jgi:hypothetical protein
VLLLVPWCLLLLALPLVLVFWVVVGAAYVCIGIVALVLSIGRALVRRHQVSVTAQAPRATLNTSPTESRPPSDTPAELPDGALETTTSSGQPVGQLPLQQKRQIAFDALAKLDADDFVAVMHDLFSALGYYNATVGPSQPLLTALDPSLDPMMVRCIPYAADGTVDAPDLQEFLALRAAQGTPRLAVVSLNPLTERATELAGRSHISIYDAPRILDLIDRADWLDTSPVS